MDKKLELEKCNEELVKINSETETEMADVSKKFVSLMKTCEDQRAQNVVLEQMVMQQIKIIIIIMTKCMCKYYL